MLGVVRRWLAAPSPAVFHGIEGFKLHHTKDLYMRRRGAQEVKTRLAAIPLLHIQISSTLPLTFSEKDEALK